MKRSQTHNTLHSVIHSFSLPVAFFPLPPSSTPPGCSWSKRWGGGAAGDDNAASSSTPPNRGQTHTHTHTDGGSVPSQRLQPTHIELERETANAQLHHTQSPAPRRRRLAQTHAESEKPLSQTLHCQPVFLSLPLLIALFFFFPSLLSPAAWARLTGSQLSSTPRPLPHGQPPITTDSIESRPTSNNFISIAEAAAAAAAATEEDGRLGCCRFLKRQLARSPPGPATTLHPVPLPVTELQTLSQTPALHFSAPLCASGTITLQQHRFLKKMLVFIRLQLKNTHTYLPYPTATEQRGVWKSTSWKKF